MVQATLTNDLAPYRSALIPAYVDYCNTVSPRHMAMSIESTTYLWWLCDRVKACRVCDLGSGFTSYVLRAFAMLADWPVTVVSVDDSAEWLDRTRQFLMEQSMPADGLVTWDAWSSTRCDGFDVIVHDLAKGELRNTSMVTAVEALNPGGMILFDDAHNNDHAASLHAACESHGMRVADIRQWTLDAVNRFSLLGVPG